MINALLFECLYAIFLIDISNPHSFELIKDLTKIIKKSNFPNLNMILIQNKKDLQNSKIRENEINKYLNSNSFIRNLELSLKIEYDIFSLLNNFDDDNNKNNILSNILLEYNYSEQYNEQMSFAIICESYVGKTSFIFRCLK